MVLKAKDSFYEGISKIYNWASVIAVNQSEVLPFLNNPFTS